MSLQDILTPGEKMLAECGPYYATSRPIIKYEGEDRPDSTHEIAYHELAGVEVVRKPSHPMMVAGTLAVISAIFLAFAKVLVFTLILALIAGALLLYFGSRGKPGYYRLILKTPPSAPFSPSKEQGGPTIGSLLILLGLKTPPDETLWRLDYWKGGSFIETVRTVVGNLPEL